MLQILIVLAIVFVGGLKVFQHLKVRQMMEQATALLANHGSLRYNDLSVSFSGLIELKGVTFVANNPDAEVDIDVLRLQTPGLFHIISMDDSQQLPLDLTFEADGFRSNLDHLVSMTGTNLSQSGNPYEHYACDDIRLFDSNHLAEMGFSSNNRTDLVGSYVTDLPNQINLTVNQYLGDFGSYQIELALTLEDIRQALSLKSLEGMMLSGLTMQVDLTEFNRARNDFCTARLGISRSAFLANHLQQIKDQAQEIGLEFNQVFYDQYWDFLHGRGQWTILFRPEKPVLLAELEGKGFVEFVDAMSIYSAITSTVPKKIEVTALAHYGQIRPDVAAGTDPQVSDPQSGSTIDDPTTASNNVLQDPPQSRDPNRLPYTIIQPEDLLRYKQGLMTVRLETLNNRLYTGRVHSIRGREVIINTYVAGGGQAQIPISVDQIREVVVLHSR